jgi:hypothetical protein
VRVRACVYGGKEFFDALYTSLFSASLPLLLIFGSDRQIFKGRDT